MATKRARVASSTSSDSMSSDWKTEMPPTEAVLSEVWHRRSKDEHAPAAEQHDENALISYCADGAAGGGKAAAQSAVGTLLTRKAPSPINALQWDCEWEKWKTRGGDVPLDQVDLPLGGRPRKYARTRSPAAALSPRGLVGLELATPQDWRTLPIFGRESPICWLPPPSPPAGEQACARLFTSWLPPPPPGW